ncbi:hypothetical protein [Kitasatospora sp. NPDC059571]|uniref:hypothetical protein n=1 Tax=Kitasatospora sp. NPDC059571 TaxID=3346871 RepID=UPI0036875C75
MPRKPGELQGDDPLVRTLARGHCCPKEHQQHLELAAAYPKIAVASTQMATISTDEHHESEEFRASVGARWPFLADQGLREAWDAGDRSSFHGWAERGGPGPTAP